MKILKRLLVSFAVLYILACTALYFGQDFILFHPHELSSDFKFVSPNTGLFEYAMEERNFEAEDGVAINALHFKRNNPSGVVLYFHGNTGNINYSKNYAGQYLQHGFDFVTYDYRTFGKTKGKRSEAVFFSDALTIYDELANKYDKIVLSGLSLGTGMAAHVASEREASLLLLHAPYSSILAMAENNYPWAPSFLVKYPLNSIRALDKVNCPVFVFHGKDDRVIPASESEKLKAAHPRIELMLLDNCGHNGIESLPKYEEALGKILTH